MADPLFINDLINQVLGGQIRIPSFQRGFVWDADRVAHLMDSIYKGYPFGSLLFWRTRTPLQTERNLGPFVLPENDPEYPIDYILDGQQRATSIFGVFQTTLSATAGEDDSWSKIYFDLYGDCSAQDSQFLFVPDDEVDQERHFPLKILFDPPSYRRFLKTMDESIADQVDELYRRFTTAKIPVQTFTTDDRAAVAIVFERINRLGVELDTLQLLSAWSWSDDFDLQEQFSDLADELSPYGFNDVGEDSDLMLRCCAAIIANDASPNTIIDLKGTDVRDRFQEVKTGIRGAVDFLRTNFNVHSTKVLPYMTIIIPLSVFFATESDQNTHPNANQHQVLVRWIWRTFFTRRYSKRLEQLNQDIREILKLKNGAAHSLGIFNCDIDASFFTSNVFNVRNVNAKTFILMLAAEHPLDFTGGGPIALGPVLRDCNKKEFHHIYPKAFLESIGVDRNRMNTLVNFCFLSRAANNRISGKRPSEYRSDMPAAYAQVAEILTKALCPPDIFHDDYERFIQERAAILVNKAKILMGSTDT
ncbi:DUF262 domain-containing protein [Desulfoscipio geothermicus]|uniref:GmrSD restriction endonucleases N-terminal domain-containing protein n=1 Tax=Desulfoscipio geothermicus DSM 3669 TaxID=1121426 RepID=A0A1I6DIJ8_9FIRM|nr:DUF262 domain-containing protein [Desulfoscipio geothermicus]SFR05285.1 hypothetical protein SAMN05660706_111112 [Desulfoscipio geothermicus DSM 3669]